MNNIWMWPQTSINSTTVINDLTVLTEIEQYFSALYAPYKVVYFSRARLALMAISAVRELSRPQLTFVQPFSSHCVLSAISHQSTPTTIIPEQSNQQIIYHQWGQKTQVNHQTYKNILIEDAVDSLILSNEHSEIFPNNAPFCVISLPKICQVSVGAIVVCQQDTDYQKLIKHRAVMEQNIDSALDHINTPSFQEATLQAKPTLVPKIEGSMQALIEGAATKIKANLAVISRILPDIALNVENLNNRLPCNVIISTSQYSEQELFSLVPFNVIEKQRTYFNYQKQSCEKVWLLPCHSQADWSGE